jgi:L-ascorbate metabolism protein UlaG (beta-lactamase superfamily)
MSKLDYLKPNVIVEPLFNQWYAWSYLIPPVTASLYITHSHLKILESFVTAPEVHIATLKNRAMAGGPFVDYDESRVKDVQLLWEKTKQEQADLIILAQSIEQLKQILKEEASGYSLEPLYAKIPESLKGYVELVYDADNNPSFRLIEGLLYHSSYYKPSSQSIALSLGNSDSRSFVLSTPRLSNVQNLHIYIPFGDRRWDQLFKMREHGGSYEEIERAFEIKNKSLFSDLFTNIAPKREAKYQGDEVRIRYLGHACILVETASVSILCDPLISYDQNQGIPRYSYENLPDTIDYALITHNHQDHVMLETLLQLRYKIKQVIVPKSHKGSLIDPSLKLILQQIGFKNVRDIDELEAISIPEGQIIGLPFLGEHGDLDIATKNAYLIQLQGKSILCAADSNNIDPHLYDHLHDLFGDLDVLFIGMECEGAPYTWGYGALLNESISRKVAKTRRLDGSNAEKAIKLVNQFQPKQVYVYAMGQEPWLSFITSIHYTMDSEAIAESNKLVSYCQSQNMISERLFGRKEVILGESMTNISLENAIHQFISYLSQLDVKLWVEGNKLRCNAPKGVLTPDLKEKIQTQKADIIAILSNQVDSTAKKEEWLTDTILDPQIIPAPLPKLPTKPAYILLTGATGFLGAFLLSQLLESTSADIYCLVRAETLELAQKRLKNCLESYSIWDDSLTERIIPIVGDLSQPLLGLSKEQFQELSEKIGF